jgi:hypothetical protein
MSQRDDHLEQSWLTGVPVPHSRRDLEAQPPKRYQCLYCKKHLETCSLLFAHEAQCDAGIHVRKMWARRLDRARKTSARTGHL